jgi:predicted fused transcriptional regulator/phosphomethylpyrimidine kinase
VFGQPRAAARPAFGGSHFTARIILAARRELANLRAALEIKHHADLVALIERMGLAARSLESVLSGAAESEARLAGLCRIFKEVYSEEEKLSIAYTEGGQAREGAIILLGETAVDVARKAIAIAEAYTTRNGDQGRS